MTEYTFDASPDDPVVRSKTGGLRQVKPVEKGRYDLIPPRPLRRLAVIYAKGGIARGDRNWEAGLSMTRTLDSALRHLLDGIDAKQRGLKQTEDHFAQAVWNLFAVMFFEDQIKDGLMSPEFDDLPRYGTYYQPDLPLADVGVSAWKTECSVGAMLNKRDYPGLEDQPNIGDCQSPPVEKLRANTDCKNCNHGVWEHDIPNTQGYTCHRSGCSCVTYKPIQPLDPAQVIYPNNVRQYG